MRIVATVGISLLALGLLAGSGLAADLGYPPPAQYDAPAPQEEFGTGWYLRGDVGWTDNTQPQIFSDIPALASSTDWTGGAGAGYRWNSWFRTDLTVNYDGSKTLSADGPTVTCAYTAQGINSGGATPVPLGYLWSPQAGTCNGREHASLGAGDLMANAYVDMGTWWGLTPYIGAGVGMSRIDASGTLNYYKTSDGSLYKADLTANTAGYPLVWVDEYGVMKNPQPTVPSTGKPVAFAPQNWSRNTKSIRYNFAWALQGGVAYAFDQHLTVDLGYRYVNLGTFTTLGSNAKKDLTSQQVRIGLRYAID